MATIIASRTSGKRLPLGRRDGKGTFGLLVMCVVGAVLLGYGVRDTTRLLGELRSWPRMDAHVSYATVTTDQQPASRRDLYGMRLLVTEPHAGGTRTVPVTGRIENGSYDGQARFVDSVRSLGTVRLLVNPKDSSDLSLDRGYSFDFFEGPVILGAIGAFILLLCVGSALSRRGRTEGGSARQLSPVAAMLIPLGFVALGAGIIYVHHRRNSTLVPVTVRVDSTDVVRQTVTHTHSSTSHRYAARLWVSYQAGGRPYHLPVVVNWSNLRSDARQDSAAAARAGKGQIYVNSHDPYDASVDPDSSGMLVPLLFALLGLVVAGLMVRSYFMH